MMTAVPAKGKKGMIMWDGKRSFIRIEDNDYVILHNDLRVIILDDDAYLYEDREVLDHSPQTLGYNIN